MTDARCARELARSSVRSGQEPAELPARKGRQTEGYTGTCECEVM